MVPSIPQAAIAGLTDIIFTPFVFTCPACELRVEYEEIEELEGLGDEVKLDESPDDFYANWEPDEDLYRGR